MDSASWLALGEESPHYRLPEDLRARDPLAGRDCGWLEQMLPFVRHFSQPGDQVLDPFAGFGTTLLAARLEGRSAVGFEVDAARLALMHERLARHGFTEGDTLALHPGACDAPDSAALPPMDLCLTNVPYFGCRWDAGADAAQLYASDNYLQHLDGLRSVFHRVRASLRDDAYCIAMVQNLRVGGRSLPLAFDLAQLLGGLFTLHEERVLVYPGPTENHAVLDSRTNRSHEYALVFRKERARIDLVATADLLQSMRAAGHAFTLIGSFARWQQDPQGIPPADADIRVDASDPQRLDALLRWLGERGFVITSWGEAVAMPLRLDRYRGRHYFRGERIGRDGALVRLDIGFE